MQFFTSLMFYRVRITLQPLHMSLQQTIFMLQAL